MSVPRDETEPAPLEANPGRGVSIRLAFSNAEREWTEEANLVDLLAEVLEAREHRIRRRDGGWVDHLDSGYSFLPQVAGVRPQDRGGVGTTTTIQVHHAELVPGGLFEYQHWAGDDMAGSIRQGFDQWAQVDLVTLLDAARVEPDACMRLVMTIPARDGHPTRTRRAILGPVAHYQARPPAPEPGAGPVEEGETHSFCPCCLLTRSFEAFKNLFEGDGFFGLRLFALRESEGVELADCRVNGEDFEAGTAGLKGYAATWPEAGYEFRKQYVILQTIPTEPDEAAEATR